MSDVRTKWQEFKERVETLEADVQKNANGNAAAGVRARKGLRELKTMASTLVKLSMGKEA